MSRRPLWKPRTLAVCICGGILAGALNWMMPGYTGVILFCGLIATIYVGRIVTTRNGLRRSMDWYLHRQAIGRLWPLLIMFSIPWLIAGYFYVDPLVWLGLAPAPKSSWDQTAHWNDIKTALTMGMAMALGGFVGYVNHYTRLRGGERFEPVSARTYVLAISISAFGLIMGLGAVPYLLLH
jgi:hypothetical protein